MVARRQRAPYRSTFMAYFRRSGLRLSASEVPVWRRPSYREVDHEMARFPVDRLLDVLGYFRAWQVRVAVRLDGVLAYGACPPRIRLGQVWKSLDETSTQLVTFW